MGNSDLIYYFQQNSISNSNPLKSPSQRVENSDKQEGKKYNVTSER